MSIRDDIDKAIDDQATDNFGRLSIFHPDLPALIAAVAGSSLNSDLYAYLEENLQTEGSVRGRSKQKVINDDEEIVDIQQQYPRPNGEIYYSRDWSGQRDVDVMVLARTHDKAPLLYGPPGTGKTALVEAAYGDSLLTVVMTGDTEVSDLVGSYIPKTDGSDGYEWIDGPLVVAASEGRPLLLDEIGLGDPKVLSIVYGLMDGRRELVVTANPARGIVRAADGFFVVGATNPNAPGVRLSEALLSRFALHVEVKTDWDLAEKLGVPKPVVTLGRNLSNKVDEGLIGWAPQFRELLAFRDVEKVFGRDFAIANLLAVCPEGDRAEVQDVASRTFGRTALPARI